MLTLILTPAEQASFREALLNDFDSIVPALSRIDVEHAKATVKEDEDTIRKLVSSSMGFHEVNKGVMEELREWLLETAKAALAELPLDDRWSSGLLHRVGRLLWKMGMRGRHLASTSDE